MQLEEKVEDKAQHVERKEEPDFQELPCSMRSIKCTDPKAMNVHTGGRAHQTQERQARLDSVNQHLASHYAYVAAAPSGPDSAVYVREN